MMVIFLTGLVSMILMRTLRNDYAKYAREEDDLETLVRIRSSNSFRKSWHTVLMYHVLSNPVSWLLEL
jgi:hypothetical protein